MLFNMHAAYERIIHDYTHLYAKRDGHGAITHDAHKKPILTKTLPRLSQSSLLLILPIVAGQNSYNYSILTTDSTPGVAGGKLPEEIRLNVNDEFFILEMSQMLYGTIAVDGGATAHRMFTHAPSQYDSKFTAIEDFWLGSLEIDVDKVTYLTNWDNYRHLVVPRTQDILDPASGQGLTQGNKDLKHDTFHNMEPYIKLSGSRKNQITTTLPYPIAPVGSPATVAFPTNDAVAPTPEVINIGFMALLCRGFLAQNASAFQTT